MHGEDGAAVTVNAALTPMLSWDTTAHLPFTAPEVVPLSHTLIRDRIEPSLKSVLKVEEQVGLIPTHVDVAIAPHDPHVAWTAIIRSFRTHRQSSGDDALQDGSGANMRETEEGFILGYREGRHPQ